MPPSSRWAKSTADTSIPPNAFCDLYSSRKSDHAHCKKRITKRSSPPRHRHGERLGREDRPSRYHPTFTAASRRQPQRLEDSIERPFPSSPCDNGHSRPKRAPAPPTRNSFRRAVQKRVRQEPSKGTGSHRPPALSARATCLLLFIITFPVCKKIGYRITSLSGVVKAFFEPGFAAFGRRLSPLPLRVMPRNLAPARPAFRGAPSGFARTWSFPRLWT